MVELSKDAELLQAFIVGDPVENLIDREDPDYAELEIATFSGYKCILEVDKRFSDEHKQLLD